mgnify:CR=1 FL=1
MDAASGFEEFVAVARAGSVSAAARTLGVPRASLSRRLSGLEERLGVLLLHRSTRRLVLTDAGQELFRRATRIVDQTRDALDAVQRLDGVPRGLLKVSIPPDGGERFAELIATYIGRYPEVEVEVLATARHVDLVAEGVDVAVRAGRVIDNSLVGRRLPGTQLVAVASPEYLARRGAPQSVADLADHDCILGFLRGERPARTWPLTDGGQVEVRGRISTNGLLLAIHLCKLGQGIAILPASIIWQELVEGRLVRVLPDHIGTQGSIMVVYPEREFLDPKVRAFVDCVVEWSQAYPLGCPDGPCRPSVSQDSGPSRLLAT